MLRLSSHLLRSRRLTSHLPFGILRLSSHLLRSLTVVAPHSPYQSLVPLVGPYSRAYLSLLRILRLTSHLPSGILLLSSHLLRSLPKVATSRWSDLPPRLNWLWVLGHGHFIS